MVAKRGTKETDRAADGGEEKAAPADIRTMTAPGGQAAPGGGPNWGALMQRFGGGGQAPAGGYTPGQGTAPLPQQGGMQPRMGMGQSPWGQHIQQAIQALSQRFGGMGQQGGGFQMPQMGGQGWQPGGITGGQGQGPQRPQWGGFGGAAGGGMQRQAAPGWPGQQSPQPGGIIPQGWGQR